MDMMLKIAVMSVVDDYIEGKKNIDQIINEIKETNNEVEKELNPKKYEDKLSIILSKIQFLENIMELKKFKKEKKDALKIYNLYLEQVKELGKLWE